MIPTKVSLMDLQQQRRFYAEEIKVAVNLRTPSLVEALARVPREKFLPPGPCLIRSEIDYGGRLREAFMKEGLLPAFSRLRRDAHERCAECWLHGETFCVSK